MTMLNDLMSRLISTEYSVQEVKQLFREFEYNTQQAIQSQFKKSWITSPQSSAMYGLRIGLCVDTKDPHAQGRIRYYLPGYHYEKTEIKQLPWAYPISVLGGFDDSGCLWVPPAGSAVALLFEVGERGSAYYFGTVWNRDRGPAPHNWGYQIPEYQCIHQGHRKGYYVGKNDESQVLPPQNTYNYNIKDYDDTTNQSEETEALRRVTPSHLYTMKTPQKHRLTFDDGNYFCNHRWKHVELASSCGHTFLMWDDHLRSPGQHVHPQAASCGGSASGGSGEGIDCGQPGCGGSQEDRQEEPKDCSTDESKFINDLFKQESEVRAFRGPCTPQNNKCELKQTGVFLSSISGHTFVLDDQVDEPRGKPEWERGTKSFDFGCTNKYLGKTYWQSATGHLIQMGDAEDEANVRSGDYKNPDTGKDEFNGVLIKTATGHSIEMNDHTLSGGKAGEKRRIKIRSTSDHVFEMVDEENDQKGENRKDGGEPKSKAKKAYIKLKSGYGLQLLMRDDDSQEETKKQFIELLAPHKDNCHGPHIFTMREEQDNNPGIVLLRAGGLFVGLSTAEWIEIVGNKEGECPKKANKITYVTDNHIDVAENYYINVNKTELHIAKDKIFLLAGSDCPVDGEDSPCIYPVIVGCPDPEKGFKSCPFTRFPHWPRSDKVFAS